MFGQSSLDQFHVSIGVMMAKNQNTPDHVSLNHRRQQQQCHQQQQHHYQQPQRQQQQRPQQYQQQHKERHVKTNAMMYTLHAWMIAKQKILSVSQDAEELISTV